MSAHSASPDLSVADEPADEVRVAVKNAATLGASLLLTWSVALVVRFFLPRYLGPERFGVLNFAESFAAAFFVLVDLGLETYIQKEIPVHPAHASDFFGGLVVLRLGLSALLFVAMAAVMALTGRPPSVQRVVFVFGLVQLVMVVNGNLAALLHAARTVAELAVVNVAAKLLWAAGVAWALLAEAGLEALVLAFLVVEVARMIALFCFTRRHLGMRMTWSTRALKLVLVASLPFYLSQVANTIYAKIDVTVLAVLSNDVEVGWFCSAYHVAGLSFLVAPLVSWVLLPLLSRAAARSEAEMFAIVRGAIRAVMMVVIPLSLLIGIGADVLSRCLLGEAFVPATLSLRILAPGFVPTYLAMIAAMCLTLLNRAWKATLVALVGLFVDPLLDIALVPRAARWLGTGGASAGAAAAQVLAEGIVAAALLASIGARAFDRASVSSIGKTILCSLLVIGADALLRPLGPARLAVDAALYVALAFALGAMRAADVERAIELLRRKRTRHAIS